MRRARHPQDRSLVLALGALDCKCAKLLTGRRNVECKGEDYESIDDIAKDRCRGGRLQLTARAVLTTIMRCWVIVVG